MLSGQAIEITDISHAFQTNGLCHIHMARLDKLDPVISGNKIFKLHYFLKLAGEKGIRNILTFGGAFSNHLAAASQACHDEGLELTAVIRGEEPEQKSHTLLTCEQLGMKTIFVSREEYTRLTKDADPLGPVIAEDRLIIPEGGYHQLGMHGAGEIIKYTNGENYSHICLPVGTATTMAGILFSSRPPTKIIGISVLKGPSDIPQRLEDLGLAEKKFRADILEGYHFGGYAKGKPELYAFMNDFFKETGIPTDFVYTGKMMYAVRDLIAQEYFPAGSKVLCLHTGGLQGNASLPTGTLNF
jgi:1-aminocyclopropane-1-carboxylate deaminase